jgi:hypothetical protein
VIARLDGHVDTGALPPVEPGPDRQHDPLLGRRLVDALRHHEAGPPHAVLVELLEDDLVEQGAKLVPDRLDRLAGRTRAHEPEDNRVE